MSSANSKTKFLSAFPRIQKELNEYMEKNYMPQDAKDWFKENLEYNVPGGKLNRGISVVDTVEILRGKPLDDPEEYFEVALLGWCIELLQAFFLVSDDIMDSSVTRRSQPCYYRVPKVGMIAINDAFMLEMSIYHLLRLHFRSRPYYVTLLELFHATTLQTELGQLIDLITAPEDSVDLARFSLLKHRLIVVYKTAFYSFYLPVALGYAYCGVPMAADPPSVARTISFKAHEPWSVGNANGSQAEADPYQVAMDILIPLGEYFQVQDDYLDCFGKDIGKIGTDILDNKCSWVVCSALDLVTPEQRALLDEHYGRKNAESEKKCKALFESLGLRERYAAYEEESHAKINSLIERSPESKYGDVTLKREVFTSFLSKIYKRQK